jgi:hypothetical protein
VLHILAHLLGVLQSLIQQCAVEHRREVQLGGFQRSGSLIYGVLRLPDVCLVRGFLELF